MAKKKEDSEKKITNEKPISLDPLGLGEALKALLQVKPEDKAEKPKTKKTTKKPG